MKLIRWMKAKINEYLIYFVIAGFAFLILGVMYFTTDWKWIIAILTPIALLFNYGVNRRSEMRQGVLHVLSMYYTKEIYEGTNMLRKLHEWYKEKHGSKTFYDYFKSYDDPQKDLERRNVSHFWITLGTLLKHGMVDKKIVYELWSQDDVGIVEKILIPLENELYDEFYKRKLTDNHPLYYIRDNKDKFYKGV